MTKERSAGAPYAATSRIYSPLTPSASDANSLDAAVKEIMSRPEFSGAGLGCALPPARRHRPRYTLAADQLFQAALCKRRKIADSAERCDGRARAGGPPLYGLGHAREHRGYQRGNRQAHAGAINDNGSG